MLHVACFCRASELRMILKNYGRGGIGGEYVTKIICGSQILKYLLSDLLQSKFAKSLNLDRLKVFPVLVAS